MAAGQLNRYADKRLIMKMITQEKFKGKSVLLRVDYNVPINNKGDIEDDARILATLPTLKYLLQSKPKEIILISHLGRPVVRPKERIQAIISGNKNLVLRPVAEKLSSWLKLKTKITVEKKPNFSLPFYRISKNILLMENIRFDLREEKNDLEFSRQLASLGDVYVDDAFAVCHREHASVVGISKYLPSFAGFLIEKEIKNLSTLLTKPEHPFVVISGGAKISDKILAIKNILKKTDYILLGGVMANTFMKGRGIDIKKSVCENEKVEFANDLFDLAPRKFILPTDLVWDKEKIVDIGNSTVSHFQKIIAKAETIFWNGTMGLTSLGMQRFKRGTQLIAKAVVESKATSIVCGGDTISEINQLGLGGKITFVSTGGGASLEFLAGEKLPGIEALG